VTHATTPQLDASASNKVVILRFIDALNKEGKSEEILERLTSSAALKNKAASYEARYPGFQITPVDLVAERDLVAVRFFTDFGTQSQASRPTAEVGRDEARPEKVEAIAICRLAGERVTEFWFESDVLGQVIAVGEEQQADANHADGRHAGGQHADGRQADAHQAEAHHALAHRSDTHQVGNRFDGLDGAGTNEVREANRSLILRYLAALTNQEKTLELVERFASDPVLARNIFAFESGFPGYSLSADEIIAEGDKVVVRFHTRQRHTREYMGIPATGKEFAITGIIICRVEKGLIAESWLQADTWALTQELGEGPAGAKKPGFPGYKGPSSSLADP